MSRRTRALRRENKKLEEQLSYSDCFEVDHVLDALKTTSLSRYEQELVRRDLLLMVIDGRARGEKPKQVLGDDSLALCEAIVAALPKPTAKDWVLRIMRFMLLGVWVWMLIVLLLNVELGWLMKSEEGMMKIRLFDVVYILALGLGNAVLSKGINQRTLKRRPAITVLLFLCYLAVVIPIILIGNVYQVEWLIPVQVGWVIIAVSGVAWLILNEVTD